MKSLRQIVSALVPALLLALAGPVSAQPAPSQPKNEAALLDFFERKVRPVLANNCYTCHSADTNAKSGLRVDDRNGLLAGGNRGPAIVPGEAGKSLLIQAISHANPKLKMPAAKKLDDEDIAVLTKWINDGAVWPQESLPSNVGKYTAKYAQLKKEHWAWQPLRDPKPPAVSDETWARDEIDRFVLAGLDKKNLKPVGDADRAALIRRVTFDLTGLPPTPEAIEAFLADTSDDAFARVVDRLLASPAFGERWGRHWLDVARYGESTGSSRNLPMPLAFHYRDYVIDSFNRDKPYNRFLMEQIAGDLMPASSAEQRDEQLTATGFLAIGVKDVNQRFKVRYIMDNVDEQIEAVSRAVLALTASCARCHDHKFDPIPTHDYYALAGIFTSSDLCSGHKNKMGGGGLDYYEPSMLLKLSSAGPPVDKAKVAELKKAMDVAKADFDKIKGTPEGKMIQNGKPKQFPFKVRFEKAQAEYQAAADPVGHAVVGARDGKVIADTPIRIRGIAEKHGPVVPRGFLTLVDVPDAEPINPAQSGRLELAKWLTSDKNPLTLRVAVNRIWHHLFGQGIVTSVDNFGVTGDTPANPELLDHLANRFVRDGWSVKKLVRAIVMTRAYQLGGDTTPAHVTADPSNRLIWRHSPRRLEAEELRDATLSIAGVLDPSRPKSSPSQELRVVEMPNNGAEARKIEEASAASRHRGVYLPLVRGLVPRTLEMFDFAEQGMVTGRRDATTVAPQALYLLNDPFVRKHSMKFAENVLGSPGDDVAHIRLAYRTALGRDASAVEVSRVMEFLAEYEQLTKASGPVQPKEIKSEPVVPKKPQSDNPDEADQSGIPAREESVTIGSARLAAWSAFTQSLIGSAEFRFLR